MSWAKIDDQFFTNPKVIELSKDAKLLYLSALTYCTGQLTDGIITPGALRVIAAMVDVSRDAAAALQSAGLWEHHENGWLIHDYHAYNPTADEAKTRKQNVSQIRSEAGSKGAASRWQNAHDNDSKAHGKRDSKTHGKTIAQSDPYPYPNPIPEESPGNKNYQGADTPPVESEKDTISHEVTPLSKPVKKKTPGEGEEFTPALTLFRSAFQTHKGRFPVRDSSVECRLQRIFDEQGEETFRRALDGFFSCVGGRDMFPKDQGFPMVVFVRQFDRWEGADQSRIRSSNGSNATGRNGSATHADAKQQSGWAKQIAADLAQRAAQA